MAEKRRVLVDNAELPGLVKVGGVPLEQGTIEVPGFGKIHTIVNGVIKIGPVEMTYRVDRGTKTRDFLNSWLDNREVHNLTIVQCDASGQEFGRILMPLAELQKKDAGEYDGANPTYAHMDVIAVPWDETYVKAQA